MNAPRLTQPPGPDGELGPHIRRFGVVFDPASRGRAAGVPLRPERRLEVCALDRGTANAKQGPVERSSEESVGEFAEVPGL